MDGETVLLDRSSGRYYTLNRFRERDLEHCTGQNTIADIHAAICDRFDVVTCPRRFVNLANELIQEGLIQQERR